MIRPIFALFIRSLREDNRAKFTPIARATLVLVILFFIAMNQRDFARRPAPGLQVFFLVMVINLFGLVIGGITAFCSAITEEKEDDTLGLLRMTNLSPVAILLGKGTSRLVSGMLLLISQVPFSLLCVTLGGVSAAHILKGYEVLLSTLFLLCNLGLLMSVISRKTGVAVALTVFTGTVLYVGAPMAYVASYEFRSGQPTGPMHDAITYLIANNPMYQLATLVYGSPGGGFPAYQSPLLFHGIAGTVCFLLAWALFGRFCSGTAESAPRKKKATAGAKLLRIPRPGTRAMVWKDFWFLTGGRRGLIARFIGYSVLVFGMLSLVLYNSNYVDSEDVGEMIMSFAGMGLGVELVLSSARIFGLERKWLTLSSLITMPISLGRIARHKVLGMLGSLIPGLCFVAMGAAIAPDSVRELIYHIAENQRNQATLFLYMGTHLLAVPLLTCWLSLKMRRGTVAAALSIGVLWNVIFGVLADEVFRSSQEGWFMFGTFLLVVVSLLLARGIARTLPLAAAAD